MRASLATGSAAAQSAAAIATASSSISCSGKTWNGSRQPNALTLTIASRHQATKRPSGSANSAVISATAMVFSSSSAASRRRVRPIAHSGASCGSRELASVSRLVKSAMPATPSVKALSAAVTEKVRLKIRLDSRFIVAWSATLRSSRPNFSCIAVISGAMRSGATRRPSRVCGVCGNRRVSAAKLTAI
jgi:hypothetical protein